MIKLLIPIIVEGDLQEKQCKYDFPCYPICSLNLGVLDFGPHLFFAIRSWHPFVLLFSVWVPKWMESVCFTIQTLIVFNFYLK